MNTEEAHRTVWPDEPKWWRSVPAEQVRPTLELQKKLREWRLLVLLSKSILTGSSDEEKARASSVLIRKWKPIFSEFPAGEWGDDGLLEFARDLNTNFTVVEVYFSSVEPIRDSNGKWYASCHHWVLELLRYVSEQLFGTYCTNGLNAEPRTLAKDVLDIYEWTTKHYALDEYLIRLEMEERLDKECQRAYLEWLKAGNANGLQTDPDATLVKLSDEEAAKYEDEETPSFVPRKMFYRDHAWLKMWEKGGNGYGSVKVHKEWQSMTEKDRKRRTSGHPGWERECTVDDVKTGIKTARKEKKRGQTPETLRKF